jgi:hypothetical protein
MAAAIFVIFSQGAAFKAASAAHIQASQDVQDAAREKKEADSHGQEKRYAAVPEAPDEEPQFISYLRQRATFNGVSLDKWSSQTTDYGKDKGSSSTDAKTTALLKGIRKISSYITFSGPYQGLRLLMGELEDSNRLLTLSNVLWTRNKLGDNVLAMSVGRYVVSKNTDSDKATP